MNFVDRYLRLHQFLATNCINNVTANNLHTSSVSDSHSTILIGFMSSTCNGVEHIGHGGGCLS